MKKQRLEFFLVILMLALGYLVLFRDISFQWKAVCIAFYGVIIFSTVFSLMMENRSAQSTLLWIYILVLLPIFGYIFYLYSGQLLLKGLLFKHKRMNDREIFAASHHRVMFDFSQLNERQRCFARYLERMTLTQPNTNTKTKVLKNGKETFREIKQKLLNAKEFIHLEYYTFRYDRLGKELIAILAEKVKEGVEVRLLYDAVGSMCLSKSDLKEINDAGVAVYPFLPIKSGFLNQKWNFRNHRKIIVIDGTSGFVGGLNVGVEYLGEDEKIGFWCDTHVYLEGDAAQTLHKVFLADWEYVCKKKLMKERKPMQEESQLEDKSRQADTKPIPVDKDGLVHVVATGPETRKMSDHFYAMITCAAESIWIASPYFVPNQAIRTALRIAAAKGIQVRVMVPEVNDGFLTQYASRSYFPELLRAGIEIYTYQKGFLHKKLIIVDGDIASIGTANMDLRSFHLNFEVNLFLTGTEPVRDLIVQYEEDLRECRRIRPVQFYKRPTSERVKESFARLFSGVL
ncbi:cardiolipin synthase [Paenibacillus sp. BSR1-1]|uniref:cardiolipin synthase n=1 Tax=Paenibacillus sp. BSR1-1 TaxID=3020845 RepID=UPI0025B20FAD|nr:cardiolipin synthase [Paenibacillus sp. BSR1-1]MDN3018040.1 cardiolipin synthase [Paenibacillus sp. BSR1-1]